MQNTDWRVVAFLFCTLFVPSVSFYVYVAAAETVEVLDITEPDENSAIDGIPIQQPKKAGEYAADSRNELILKFYKENKLLNIKSYPAIRKAVVEQLTAKYRNQIQSQWGSDSDPFVKWLNEHVAIKEEFLLAIDPAYDDIAAAIRLFKQLWEKYPKKFEQYPALAIATAVVWDKPNDSIFGDYRWQFQAIPATDPADAFVNFEYYSSMESIMSDRIKLLPWEFLTFIVCHKTTIPERKWAVENYLPQRKMIGEHYFDVAWIGIDPPPLKGLPYTLMNMRKYGGVCACQSDFAMQLSRSLGVPAYRGNGPNHAWVIWIEIQSLSSNSVKFSVEQAGRYREGKYYVGGTCDSQTGRNLDEWMVGLKLHRIAMNVVAYRQAKLIMQSYDNLVESETLTVKEQLALLKKINEFSPGCEEAWNEIALLGKNGEFGKKDGIKRTGELLDMMFGTFAKTPDYTLNFFEDIIDYDEIQSRHDELYGKLFFWYQKIGRPDLLFRAKVNYFKRKLDADENIRKNVIVELGKTCIQFAGEDYHLSTLLDEMDRVAIGNENLNKLVAEFYRQFLTIMQRQPDDFSKEFRRDTFQRATRQFEILGNRDLAAAAKTQAKKAQSEIDARD